MHNDIYGFSLLGISGIFGEIPEPHMKWLAPRLAASYVYIFLQGQPWCFHPAETKEIPPPETLPAPETPPPETLPSPATLAPETPPPETSPDMPPPEENPSPEVQAIPPRIPVRHHRFRGQKRRLRF